MIDHLPLFHRIAGRPVVVLGSGEAAEARRRLVARAGGSVIGDLGEGIERGARFAFITHEDDAAAESDAIRARGAGLLVNVTDRPGLCDFTVPSILDRSPVLVAIGTGGVSAGLAKQLRLRLEQIVPQSLGALATALGTAREALRARFPDAGNRRRALDAALAQGGPLDPLAPGGADRMEDWLAGASTIAGETIEIVLRSDDPEDLTLREARLLGTADLVAFETGVAPQILDRVRADAKRVTIAPAQVPPAGDGLVILLRASDCPC
ncbi:uroporphyrin-III C-methyltransferase / precorrin-2 dehydrogenase / sirohydrochlorin ferrochelatase [Novosphingobium sp. CF614]|uniref:precorrin-2 dehydrogenase/sirohydrochlorin ferrochelatase family protein n=1 Tax=Novosphingobium sp. CF614 TaxID=1884364 RepID=UPI0008E280E4|nr:bifunctional precorrin-2 dehydrogenase/sirohydrochlorin ferrochelatase [Novosphingobium sp. CF614]SFF83269.1 uroporphyrin-III C-methyltransferase / precorrin-2 dehydrogenase / sirohydrochlorin ferrochelatase [Novosphingobium sp. CF614]